MNAFDPAPRSSPTKHVHDQGSSGGLSLPSNHRRPQPSPLIDTAHTTASQRQTGAAESTGYGVFVASPQNVDIAHTIAARHQIAHLLAVFMYGQDGTVSAIGASADLMRALEHRSTIALAGPAATLIDGVAAFGDKAIDEALAHWTAAAEHDSSRADKDNPGWLRRANQGTLDCLIQAGGEIGSRIAYAYEFVRANKSLIDELADRLIADEPDSWRIPDLYDALAGRRPALPWHSHATAAYAMFQTRFKTLKRLDQHAEELRRRYPPATDRFICTAKWW